MTNEPKTVPERLDEPINYKTIGLIIACVIITHVVVNFGLDDPDDFTISIISIINPLAGGIMGVIVGLRYSGTKVFQKAYLALGAGLLAVAVGEILYFIYDVFLNQNPFPSVADIFFLTFYPLMIVHLVTNIRFFAPNLPKIPTLSWLIILPIAIIVVILNLYGTSELNLEFVVSMGYIIPATVSLTMTIYGTVIFKQGLLGKIWLILLFGVLSITFADIWYFYLEIDGSFDLRHPVNVFWYAGYWIIVYALYKHRKNI